jgi:ankyrin repeat protein
MLLSAGANPHFSMGDETPLHIASERGHTEIVRALIRAGACIDTPNMRGNTPLQYALSGTSNIDIIAMLLDAGVDVDSVIGEREKNTPIYIAVLVALGTGNIEAVKLLLARGADVTIENAHGKTALDFVDDRVINIYNMRRRDVQKQIKQMLWDHLNPDPR